MDSVPRCPLLLVLTYRPGYAQPARRSQPIVTRVALASLSAEDSARMAEDVLATERCRPSCAG